MPSRSDHTTKRTATPARATRAHTADEKRRPAPAASTTRRRGAEKTEAATKKAQTKAAASKTAEKKAPAKKRLPKNAKIDRPELEGVDPAVAAAHAQADDVTTDSLQLFFNA